MHDGKTGLPLDVEADNEVVPSLAGEFYMGLLDQRQVRVHYLEIDSTGLRTPRLVFSRMLTKEYPDNAQRDAALEELVNEATAWLTKNGNRPPQELIQEAGWVDEDLARRLAEMLNSAFFHAPKQDQLAMKLLLRHRVPVSGIVADHPTIVVMDEGFGDDFCTLTMLGLLNGICGSYTVATAPRPDLVGFGPLCVLYDDTQDVFGGFNLTMNRPLVLSTDASGDEDEAAGPVEEAV